MMVLPLTVRSRIRLCFRRNRNSKSHRVIVAVKGRHADMGRAPMLAW